MGVVQSSRCETPIAEGMGVAGGWNGCRCTPRARKKFGGLNLRAGGKL